jgi:hypothetical protein
MYRKILALAVVAIAAVAAVGFNAKTTHAQAAPPVANAGGPYAGVVGQVITFSANASTGSNLSFVWQFGDGTTANGPVVSKIYNHTGQFTVQLAVIDSLGRSSFAPTTATIGSGIANVVTGASNCFLTVFGVQCTTVAVPSIFNSNCGLFGFANNFCFFFAPQTNTWLSAPMNGALYCPTPSYTPACRFINR